MAHYIAQNPSARVHWIIPVHGPIIVPDWSDPISDSQTPKGGPAPSSGDLAAHLPSSDSTKRPAVLAWTSELLCHFMSAFLVPLHQRPDLPFGPLSIKLSGSKPDPFIALTPPPPPSSHTSAPIGKRDMRPVRVETGDHIRVYCNAKHALALRTWFHGIEVDRGSIQSGEGILKLFHRVRLVLVGERGEALVVA